MDDERYALIRECHVYLDLMEDLLNEVAERVGHVSFDEFHRERTNAAG